MTSILDIVFQLLFVEDITLIINLVQINLINNFTTEFDFVQTSIQNAISFRILGATFSLVYQLLRYWRESLGKQHICTDYQNTDASKSILI